MALGIAASGLHSISHHALTLHYHAASTAVMLPLKGPVRVMPPVVKPKSHTTSRIQWLGRLIQAEAGNQPFLVRLCVGDVVLNRMQAAGFPHHLRQVILQPGQFSSVSNGTFAQAVPTPQTIRAAENALNGWNPVPTALYFFNPSLPHSAWMNTLTNCHPLGAMVFCP
jgi:N-acetylmuramoyl-L-alanine amidase